MTISSPGECQSYCLETPAPPHIFSGVLLNQIQGITTTFMLYIAGRGDVAAGKLGGENVNSFFA